MFDFRNALDEDKIEAILAWNRPPREDDPSLDGLPLEGRFSADASQRKPSLGSSEVSDEQETDSR